MVYFDYKMRELQQKQKIKKRIYSIPALILLFIFTILAIHGAYDVVMKDRESAQYVKDLNNKLTDLSSREAQLKTEIARLNTDEGVNTVIKEKFSVSEPGEHVAIIVDQSQASTSTPTDNLNWFQKLWRGFLSLW
jgi:cell division protein FtsB